MPSLSEIGDLSIIAPCLALPGFVMDTLLKMFGIIPLLKQKISLFYSLYGNPVRFPPISPRNDPDPEMIPNPEMISKLTPK